MRVFTTVVAVLAATSILSVQAPRVMPRPQAQLPNAPPDGNEGRLLRLVPKR